MRIGPRSLLESLHLEARADRLARVENDLRPCAVPGPDGWSSARGVTARSRRRGVAQETRRRGSRRPGWSRRRPYPRTTRKVRLGASRRVASTAWMTRVGARRSGEGWARDGVVPMPTHCPVHVALRAQWRVRTQSYLPRGRSQRSRHEGERDCGARTGERWVRELAPVAPPLPLFHVELVRRSTPRWGTLCAGSRSACVARDGVRGVGGQDVCPSAWRARADGRPARFRASALGGPWRGGSRAA